MRIQGPHPSINMYKQLQQQKITKSNPQQKDQLNISNTAKKMQQNKLPEAKRAEYVQEIKNLVQSGEYKIDDDKLAQKMISFWSKGV